MAKYCTPMDTFADVEELYNSIKPIRKRDPHLRDEPMWQGVRPINCRDRQLECVRKLTRNKYALCDYDTDHTVYMADFDPYTCTDHKTFNEFIEKHAAILWERKRNGDEVITVRNLYALGECNPLPIRRSDFLYRHLPRQWYVSSEGGNQYLQTPLGNFILPKNNFLPRMLRKPKTHMPNLNTEQIKKYFESGTSNAQLKEDKRLVFTRRGGQWLAPEKTYEPLKWRIDTKRKKKVYPVIRKFVTHNLPMMAMLKGGVQSADEDIQAFIKYLDGKVLYDRAEGEFPVTVFWAMNGGALEARKQTRLEQEVLNIMRDLDHTHAFGLVKYITRSSAGYANTCEDLRVLVNRWVNKFFCFKHKVEA